MMQKIEHVAPPDTKGRADLGVRCACRWNSKIFKMTIPKNKEVAYCGLYCGNCLIRNGKIGFLSKKMLDHIDTPEFQKLAAGLPNVLPELFCRLKNYQSFLLTLKAMTNLDCKHICKNGGGSTDCKIRRCCQKNSYDGCWECNDFFNDCNTLAWLNPVHDGTNVKNIRRIRMIGMEDFIKGPKLW